MVMCLGEEREELSPGGQGEVGESRSVRLLSAQQISVSFPPRPRLLKQTNKSKKTSFF